MHCFQIKRYGVLATHTNCPFGGLLYKFTYEFFLESCSGIIKLMISSQTFSHSHTVGDLRHFISWYPFSHYLLVTSTRLVIYYACVHFSGLLAIHLEVRILLKKSTSGNKTSPKPLRFPTGYMHACRTSVAPKESLLSS